MKIDSFKQYFHPSWWVKMKPFLESEEFEEIWNKIKDLGSKGKIVYPYSKLLKEEYPNITNTIFKPFQFDFNELQVLIFSELSSSFTNFKTIGQILNIKDYYKVIEKSVYNGLNFSMIKRDNLDYLSSQGVMILGNSLTSEIDLPHYPIWEPMMKHVLTTINSYCRGVHIVLLGVNTHKYSKILDQKSHYVYKSSINYDNYDMFNIIADRIKKNNNIIINWAEEEVPF